MKNIKVSFRPFPQNCFTFQAPRRSGCKQVVHTFCLCHGQLLRAVLEATSRDVVQLIVCGVLAVGRSLTQRRDLLTAFGFKEKDRVSIQLDSVTLTWVAGGALLIVFLCSTVYFFALNAFDGTQLAGMARDLKNDHLNVIPRDMHMVLWWSVIACLMHLLTLTGGYVLQRSLENSRERLQIGRPRPLAPRAQVAEAIWAASFGFSLTIYMLAALAAAAGRFETLNNCWWWATVPGVTAFFAALYTQKVERLSRQLNLFFWMQGAVTGLVSILVFILLYSDALWGKVAQQLSGDAQLSVLAFGLYVGITKAILGLALGRILHMWVTSERYAGQSDRRMAKDGVFCSNEPIHPFWLWVCGQMRLPFLPATKASRGNGRIATAILWPCARKSPSEP